MLQYITENEYEESFRRRKKRKRINEYEELLDVESVPSNFNELAIQASYIINKDYIVDEQPSEEVKYTTAKIVQLLDNVNNSRIQIGNLSSTSIEGWSESYKTDAEIDEQMNKSIYEILNLYLTTTKRRTRGVILCE